MDSWYSEVKKYFESKDSMLLGFEGGMVFWEDKDGIKHGSSEEGIAKNMKEEKRENKRETRRNRKRRWLRT